MKLKHPRDNRWPRRQRGAALLVAMLIVTLVATLAAGMVWQQWRAVEVETAERARVQAGWLVQGAVDWARLILRTDAQDGKHRNIDSLDEVWATPLMDVKLSDFLAADRNNTADTGLDAVLSGQIQDAQARYNLRNLSTDKPDEAARQIKILSRLCNLLGLGGNTAARIAQAMAADRPATTAPPQAPDANQPVTPRRVEQLAWIGLDAPTIARLDGYVTLLPAATKINLNTAPVEVLLAAVDGLDRASAERLSRERMNGGFATLNAAQALLPATITLDGTLLDVKSDFFDILGELRYETFVLRERSLVQRSGSQVRVLRRETDLPPPPPASR